MGEHDLGQPGFVAEDHELDPLLVADGLDPATELHLFTHPLGQVRDQRSLHLGADPIRARAAQRSSSASFTATESSSPASACELLDRPSRQQVLATELEGRQLRLGDA